MVLQNVFTMRRVGNKTHGDMAEVAISEFINQYMYDFSSKHVGKDLFRAKSHEEDIVIRNKITKQDIPVSLKAYGVGPLQLSTDKSSSLFATLSNTLTNGGNAKNGVIDNVQAIKKTLAAPCFDEVRELHVLPLIYNEKQRKCNILIFDIEKAFASTSAIKLITPATDKRRKHPIFRFETKKGEYICEVRYGDARANALQRGLWTHTVHAAQFFHPLSDQWVEYSDNEALLELLSKALVASSDSHALAVKPIMKDIQRIRDKTN